ncbi:MAG TPA: NAD(P)H-dependent oxidoreductase [Luteimonas sp.]|nr:NAD(P)H-dependent oxidoreductase [Luteimonas sp.]
MRDFPPLRLAVVCGSTREGRFCDTVTEWTLSRIEQAGGFGIDVVDPRRLDEAGGPEELAARLQRADAFIVVTPEYNHGYPAPLKALIDAVGQPWQAKPVAFVSYGGISGGLRAVEQLRQVFAELHASTLRDCVSFADSARRFDAGGTLLDPGAAEEAMRVLLARLRWWARALRAARTETPYAEAA